MALSITNALKLHLGLPETADDKLVKSTTLTKLGNGELTHEKLEELTKAPSAGPTVAEQVAAEVAKALKAHAAATAVAEPEDDDEWEQALANVKRQARGNQPVAGNDGDALTSYNVLKGGAAKEKDPVSLRVKAAVERWSDSTKAATYKNLHADHPLYGTPICHEGEELNLPSQRKKAMSAAWFKSDMALDIGHDKVRLTEQDRDMIMHILHTEKFYADENSTAARKLTHAEIDNIKNYRLGFQKAPLISTSTSGGNEAVPQFFDTNLIILPVLGNQVGPYVNMVDVPRGIAAHTFTMNNPTFAYAPEGSATTVFDATNFIAAHDTTFYRAAGVFQVGINFLQDAIPTMFDEIENAYSRKAAEWVDRVVVDGNGTQEPLGIFNDSGVTLVQATNPTNGAWVIGDFINLFSGVPLAYKQMYRPEQMAYFGTETTYFRARSIATGVTGDTRLVFGMDIASYRLFNTHYGVLAYSGATNGHVGFCQLGGYRLYRRQGLKFRRESAGITLLQSNTIAIGADMRFGGQLDRGAYAAVILDGMS